jgi:hypothetical protein
MTVVDTLKACKINRKFNERTKKNLLIKSYSIMLTMTENQFTNTAINPTNTFLFNPEAHTSLQLLNRRSSDEDDDDDEEEEEEVEGDEPEEEDDEVDEIEEDNGDNTLVSELNDDPVNHSTSPPTFSSLPSRPFPTGWGRGARSLSIVIIFYLFISCNKTFRFQSPLSPTSTPVVHDCVTVENEYKSEVLLSKQTNGDDQHLTTMTKITTTTTRTTNGYSKEYFPVNIYLCFSNLISNKIISNLEQTFQ